jgi:hypothetical protein
MRVSIPSVSDNPDEGMKPIDLFFHGRGIVDDGVFDWFVAPQKAATQCIKM